MRRFRKDNVVKMTDDAVKIGKLKAMGFVELQEPIKPIKQTKNPPKEGD